MVRRRGLHLTSLGFGGQCHLDAMMGRVIADLPADYITLKPGDQHDRRFAFGTDLPGGHRRSGADHPRQTPGHTDGPRVTQGFPPHETVPNAVNYTIEGMRRDMEDVHRRLLSLGDRNLIYVDGLEVFDLELIERYTEDQCHPDGDGIEVQADRFDRAVMDRLLPP